MKKISNILWGLVLIALGVIIFLRAFNIVDVNIFFRGWWTLFLIIPSFIGLFKDDKKTGNIIILIIGILLLLGARGVIAMNTVAKCIAPVILVVIGINVIFKDKVHIKISEEIKEVTDKNKNSQYDDNEIYATFSGQKLDFTNEEFKGTKLNAIFGGIDLNLNEAIINSDVVVEATAIFGGINILVPPGVNVKVKSNSMFGGVSNKIKNAENEHTIYVKSMCMFGGVEIK